MLVPEIPSKQTASREYNVVIMYVPSSQALQHNCHVACPRNCQLNWMGYRFVIYTRLLGHKEMGYSYKSSYWLAGWNGS